MGHAMLRRTMRFRPFLALHLVLLGALSLLPADAMAKPVTRHAAKPGTGILRILPFAAAAFPYDGDIPDQQKPFLDVTQGDRRGHTSPRGGILWADQTYDDKRVLLYVPPGFDPRRPAMIVVYFHGNQATLARDVYGRQQVPQQLRASGLNAVLVAPQLAVDALDSSAGHFWERNFFAKFMDEAALHLAEISGLPASRFRSLPIVIVAYSGGYLPAIYAAQIGGAGERLRGIVLLDALFGETDKYADWVARNQTRGFFLSASSKATQAENETLRGLLEAQGLRTRTDLPASLDPGSIAFISAPDAVHNDFVTSAWTSHPLRAILSRIKRFSR